MKSKTTVFRGLTFDILVEEVQSLDPQGALLWYLAAIYLRDRSGVRHLVRKSRLPGAADELAALVRRDGLRVFDRINRTIAGTEDARQANATRPDQPRQHQPDDARRRQAP